MKTLALTPSKGTPPTPRWTPLRYHPVQAKLWRSTARFNTVAAGRRSGKTELAKRKVVKAAWAGTTFDDPRFFCGAPTRDQAKRIFWDDLKALSPAWMIADISETELSIQYINGSSVLVVGLDKPERIEGSPWDGGVITEIANVKAPTWPKHVRPALSDRKGWCNLEGVPEGRNHFYDLNNFALADVTGEWAAFHWLSSSILPPEEIAAAMRELDPITYQQEYEASFINFGGRAYYVFTAATHAAVPLPYNPKAPLIFCLDFNVSPGVACVCQEMVLPNKLNGTGVIGEVWIPQNSNTPAVCRKLIADWEKHEGPVRVYGDATGGSGGTAKVSGSDWDLVTQALRPVFKDRLSLRVPSSNPTERSRINALNTRMLNGAKEIHLMVDPKKAPHVVKDLEGVPLLQGGSGEIDKKKDPMLTHISDGLGYYVVKEFPIQKVVPGFAFVPTGGRD